ncbi:MAG TPA: cytochrome c [Arenimonas sp.]|nr:cytochrome c [Arenimonas sp.]
MATLPAHAKGDPAKGKALFYTCTGCHGIADYKNAYPNYKVPKVGGQNEQYLIGALTAYRSGDRKHPTMQAQAESFTDQEIADIAAYLASLAPAQGN